MNAVAIYEGVTRDNVPINSTKFHVHLLEDVAVDQQGATVRCRFFDGLLRDVLCDDAGFDLQHLHRMVNRVQLVLKISVI